MLRIRLLGGLVVDGVAERDLGSRKGRTLLKLLALGRGSPVSVDRAAEVLWGDDPPSRPGDQVGVLVSRLRRVLGPERLPRRDGGYALVADWLDVDELTARADEAGVALATGRVAAARATAEAALALARGPLLADEDGAWAEVERASVDSVIARARLVAMEAAASVGDHSAAASLAEAALAHDPYDEVALRALMRAQVASGRPASALAAYGRVRTRLADDLGVSPTVATDALHREVLLLDEAGTSPMPAAPVLTGRAAELRVLDAALERAAVGGGTTVQVVGEAGIGKSTLVETWGRGAAARGSAVLVGRCDELGRDLPLQPIVDALASHLSDLGRHDVDLVLGADAVVLAPVLGVTAPDLGGATVVADVELGRLQLYAALLGAIGRTSGRRPAVLLVEDLHHAGPSTLGWLAFAARRPARLLLLATTRHGATVLPGALTLPLGPLDLEAAVELVGEERAADLHQRSGGHPLFLMALAASDDAHVPATVLDAVEGWVASLGDAGTTVQTAAVLGPDVDLDLLADVLGRPAVEVLGHLEAAMAVGLLVERGAGFTFRNELVRGALEAAGGPARVALAHRAAAQALGPRPGADPLVVAIHARAGGDRPLAIESFVAAAGIAMTRFELDAAETHLRAALALGPSAAASTARARARVARFDLAGAAEDVQAAFAAGGGASTLEVAAWVAYYQRRYEAARTYADEGVLRAADASVRASCLAIGGRARHGAGDLQGALERLQAGASEPAPLGIRGVAEAWLANARLHQGRPARGPRRGRAGPGRSRWPGSSVRRHAR